MIWMWILAGLAGLLVVVAIVGSLLPEDYRAEADRTVDGTPEDVWARIQNVERFPMAAGMAKSVTRLPDEDGGAVWEERMSGSTVRVRQSLAEPPHRAVREMADRVVPVTARAEIELAPDGNHRTRVTLRNHITIRSGTWHVPVFRVMMAMFGGARGGVRAWLRQLPG